MNAVTDTANLFENSREFPDFDAQMRLNRLVGLDEYKSRLTKMLSFLVNPSLLESWVNKFHGDQFEALQPILNRPPLIVLAGDVGSGKTELAETISDSVARNNNIDVTLLPLSLASRGQGRVGEMTQLVAAAFKETQTLAAKYKNPNGKARGAVILLIDEADALAQSRESEQMHHEDRAGVNALIRGIDTLANAGLPAAVIMCTNRLDALDPAVKRRAAEIFPFKRPSLEQRKSILEKLLSPFNIDSNSINQIATLTGKTAEREYGFSYSDIAQRLIPAFVIDAFPKSPVAGKRAIEITKTITPTPPFGGSR